MKLDKIPGVVDVFMIENTADETFWTNLGFKKDHGNLYRSTGPAQRQINKGKLAMFIHHGFGVKAEDVKISKFVLSRAEVSHAEDV